MTSFFRFVNKRASYPFGIISVAHAPVIVTDLTRIMLIEGCSNKTLQRKPNIEQHDHTKNGGAPEGQAVQAPLVASTILKSISKMTIL
jgi:hypothetical protein